ncbi:hypothetical protein NY2A_b486R [Paramecium bursaria Chlorella virus NY2A]|uniref:Uncharacterized protein b486R n=1 Tax=Paramecium bursaria Chlorella virus NY2A TaxID=46021 RepID=A7IX11_PBCVN|nr:hypothetical protein NY2A_b486R [Paramecium bursaria Chlorella virus NY2A]ABT14885.1 hypothetical protein NY2A_b486R [Paramecium bursaria Chlorella virus NY2A]
MSDPTARRSPFVDQHMIIVENLHDTLRYHLSHLIISLHRNKLDFIFSIDPLHVKIRDRSTNFYDFTRRKPE